MEYNKDLIKQFWESVWVDLNPHVTNLDRGITQQFLVDNYGVVAYRFMGSTKVVVFIKGVEYTAGRTDRLVGAY